MTTTPTLEQQNTIAAIKAAQDILILLPTQVSIDTITAGLGLYHSLVNLQKNVTIGSSNPLSQSLDLPGLDQITSKIGNRNLVISLKVDSRDSIDKVSYNLDETGKVFNLVIQPKKGHPPLKSNDIDYSYSGVQADAIIIIGANRLEDVGQIYKDEQKLFTDATTIAVGRITQAKFAQHHFIAPEANSVSESIYLLVTALDDKLDSNCATCILAGIDALTNNLTNPNLNPATFEMVAQLIRAGAKRQLIASPTGQSAPTNPITVSPTSNQVPQDWLAPKIYSGTGPNLQ